jgi:hypothetical protein
MYEHKQSDESILRLAEVWNMAPFPPPPPLLGGVVNGVKTRWALSRNLSRH